MRPDEALTPLEREIGRRWKDQRSGDCLTGEELVALAALGERCQNYVPWMHHVVSCPSCFRLLEQFRALEANRRPSLSTRSRSASVRLAFATTLLLGMIVCWFGVRTFLNSRVQVALQDANGRIALTAADQLVGLPELPAAEQALLVSVLRSGRIAPAPVLASLRSPREKDAFSVHAPRGTVIAALQPEFTWKMPPGAVFCRVFMTCVNLPRNNVKTKALTADHWKPKRPLAPGAIYDWQVVAYDRRAQERARVPGRFQVLESKQATALAQLRQIAGHSHLVMGVAYAHAGLMQEAQLEFVALAQTNIASPVAHTLLQSVQAMQDI